MANIGDREVKTQVAVNSTNPVNETIAYELRRFKAETSRDASQAERSRKPGNKALD